MTEMLSDKDLKIIKLKAELFDLQTQMGSARARMEEKLRELNQLLKEEKEPS